ncbi:bifunctional folylpolyglutamate synthase/dihydrofolate synthase [Dictyobacter aurantiacus]|uniref:tetrahydrofolate synthase n=1 Tax=Dictyobacter aurantiacus TaxID=1936993 RepID=A0A401Z9Z8_9CHLR|nr:folylpolyglutamate synthase/dihydrofolate synthase family protein [Dictyobacter aurantiacus]GCE03687.1 bifunctional folylpolyglutamate synthase/dihydrofolate synthase [Dictyobacter aurantiacus]
MNYKEALAYIYSFTDYERSGKYTRDRNENILREAELLKQLGNPHLQYSNTLIAGTKGKGSTAAYIERVLREAGLRTGLYTQPDLHTFRERSQTNGHLIGEQELADLVPEIKAAVQKVEASQQYGPFITYEIGTALALLYFARQHVQHAVVEVGLGGRLDATNVTQPLVSVITSISYDHMSILGDTLTKIATEKAGIIKLNGLVVTSAQSPEALEAITSIARQRNARIVRVGAMGEDPAQAEVEAGQVPPLDYRYQILEQREDGQRFAIQTPTGGYHDLETPLLGEHQVENATAAVATLEELRKKGIVWDERALRSGLAAVHWPARMQIVGRAPTIVVDGAHNADSMNKLLHSLRSTFDPHRLLIVLGVNKDKDIAHMLQELADVDSIILTHANNPRAMRPEELQNLLQQYAPQVQVHLAETCQRALDLATDLADASDLICATGSLYLAGEALRWAADHGDVRAASEIEGVDH